MNLTHNHGGYMTFLEEAKALLNDEKFTRLELLRIKISNFEATEEEQQEFFSLQNEVKTLIAKRDREKNLSFIKDPSITLEDLLRIKKATEKQLKEYIKKYLRPEKTKDAVIIGKVKFMKSEGNGESQIETEEDINFGGKRMSREAMEAIRKAGAKGFYTMLNDEGKKWLAVVNIPDRGPYKDKKIYPNISKVALRFKLDKAELIKIVEQKAK